MKKANNQLIKSNSPLEVWGAGTLNLYGVEMDAYILEDGTPLIGRRKILRVLGRGAKGDYAKDSRPSFLNARGVSGRNACPFYICKVNAFSTNSYIVTN